MALRLVQGTFLDHEENPVEGIQVLFIPESGTYDESASYTRVSVSDTTDENGEIAISLRTGQRYKVVEPGDTTYYITVPVGTGTLSLEALRATEAAAPVATNVLQTAIDATLAALGFNGLTTIADPFAAKIDAFDSVLLDADGESVEVDLVPTVPEAEDANGAWLWVRVNIEAGPNANVFFGDASVPANTYAPGNYFFSLFMPLTNGAFNLTATGSGATVNVTIYPQAVQ